MVIKRNNVLCEFVFLKQFLLLEMGGGLFFSGFCDLRRSSEQVAVTEPPKVLTKHAKRSICKITNITYLLPTTARLVIVISSEVLATAGNP